MDQRPTPILAETERYRITGTVFLPPDGYRSRLSDYLSTPERGFLAMTDVELTSLKQRSGRAAQVPGAIAAPHRVRGATGRSAVAAIPGWPGQRGVSVPYPELSLIHGHASG